MIRALARVARAALRAGVCAVAGHETDETTRIHRRKEGRYVVTEVCCRCYQRVEVGEV